MITTADQTEIDNFTALSEHLVGSAGADGTFACFHPHSC